MRHNNYILPTKELCNKERVLQRGYYASALITEYASEYIWLMGKNNFNPISLSLI